MPFLPCLSGPRQNVPVLTPQYLSIPASPGISTPRNSSPHPSCRAEPFPAIPRLTIPAAPRITFLHQTSPFHSCLAKPSRTFPSLSSPHLSCRANPLLAGTFLAPPFLPCRNPPLRSAPHLATPLLPLRAAPLRAKPDLSYPALPSLMFPEVALPALRLRSCPNLTSPAAHKSCASFPAQPISIIPLQLHNCREVLDVVHALPLHQRTTTSIHPSHHQMKQEFQSRLSVLHDLDAE